MSLLPLDRIISNLGCCHIRINQCRASNLTRSKQIFAPGMLSSAVQVNARLNQRLQRDLFGFRSAGINNR